MQERFPAHEVELADVVFDAGDGGERREVPFVRVQVKEAGFGDWGEMDAPTAAEVAVVRHVHVDARLPVEARKALSVYMKDSLEDDVWRAYGILRYARSLSEKETLTLLSKVRLGIDLRGTLTAPDASTGSYLYICAPDGDMAMAVSDMEIYERLTPAYLATVLPILNGASLVALDANLPAPSLDFLAAHCTAPLFADPVSAAKAPRLRGVLGRLHTLKPNRIEAAALSGVPITDEESLLRAVDALLETGLRRVFLTLGQDGILAAEGRARIRLPNPPVTRRVNASGCGDAFTAALCWAALRGAGLEESARCALAAASVAMESAETVNPDMSEDMIRSRMENHNAYFESLS